MVHHGALIPVWKPRTLFFHRRLSMFSVAFALVGTCTFLPTHSAIPARPAGSAIRVQLSPFASADSTAEMMADGFGGCVQPSDKRFGWQGAALAGAATYLWYLGTNTQTNRDREAAGEEPGVRRRAVLLVIALQLGAAGLRGGAAKECTPEEYAARNR